MKINLSLIPLLLVHRWYSVSSEEKCVRTLKNGKDELHCCDNREEKNGVCIGCLDGFMSEAGEPCHTCPVGTYGRKCADICHCDVYQRCNNIQGCLNYSGFKIDSKDSSTKWKMNDSRTASEPGIWIPQTELIYVICTSVFILAVILCTLWFRHLKKRRQSRSVHITNNTNTMSLNSTLDDLTVEQFRTYDYIDEDIVVPIMHTMNTDDIENQTSIHSEFESADTETSLNDGYFNPYQTVIYSPERHSYTKPDNTDVNHLKTQRDITTTETENTDNEVNIEVLSSSYNPYHDAISAQPNTDCQKSSHTKMHQSSCCNQSPES